MTDFIFHWILMIILIIVALALPEKKKKQKTYSYPKKKTDHFVTIGDRGYIEKITIEETDPLYVEALRELNEEFPGIKE